MLKKAINKVLFCAMSVYLAFSGISLLADDSNWNVVAKQFTPVNAYGLDIVISGNTKYISYQDGSKINRGNAFVQFSADSVTWNTIYTGQDPTVQATKLALDKTNNVLYLMLAKDRVHGTGIVLRYDLKGEGWTDLGAPGASSIAVSQDGTIYLASCQYNIGKTQVYSYSSTDKRWNQVGSDIQAQSACLSVSGSDVYCASFRPYQGYNDIYVQKFNFTSGQWENVGQNPIDSISSLNSQLSFVSNGDATLYLAYSNNNFFYQKEYNGQNWKDVFHSDTLHCQAGTLQIFLSLTEVLYITYQEENSNLIKVFKFDDNNLKDVSPVNQKGNYPALATSDTEDIYLVFQDLNSDASSGKATLLEATALDPNWNVVGSPQFTQTKAMETCLIADDMNSQEDTLYLAYHDDTTPFIYGIVYVQRYKNGQWNNLYTGTENNSDMVRFALDEKNKFLYLGYDGNTLLRYDLNKDDKEWTDLNPLGVDSVTVDNNGRVFIIYKNENTKLSVEFCEPSDNTWHKLGNDIPIPPNYTFINEYDLHIAVSPENKYFISFYTCDNNGNDGLFVMKYDDSSKDWVYIGSGPIATYNSLIANNTNITSLAVSNDGTPYVICPDQTFPNYKAVSVMRYIDNKWQYVGAPGFCKVTGVMIEPQVMISPEGITYVAFEDYNKLYPLQEQKQLKDMLFGDLYTFRYVNNKWENVSPLYNGHTYNGNYPYLSFTNNDHLYMGLMDCSNYPDTASGAGAATVVKFK